MSTVMETGAKPRTRERILLAARALFNAEGYGALSAVDVAHALEMSPGHLYYHFKGKAEIAHALLDAYEAELALVLDGALRAFGSEERSDEPALQTLWTHVHILLEETIEVLFFCREPANVAPERFVRVYSALRAGLDVMLESCIVRGALALPSEAVEALAGQIALAILFQPVALMLIAKDLSPRALVRRAGADIMALAAAHAR
jgi:AcrR family transcriptional regulator